MAELRDGVPLTELGVITRWSLAVRQSEAERADLIAELRADLAWLEKNSPRRAAPAAPTAAPVPEEIAEPEVEDAPARRTAAPLRRLPKPAPASLTQLKPAAAKAAGKASPSKAPAAKAAPAKAAPAKAAATRGRRPAAGE